MSEDDSEVKGTPTGDLSEEARAKRGVPNRQRPPTLERTTLNMNGPAGQAGQTASPDQLGETLVERGLITRHQLFNALNESYSSGQSLRESLKSLGYVDEDGLRAEGL